SALRRSQSRSVSDSKLWLTLCAKLERTTTKSKHYSARPVSISPTRKRKPQSEPVKAEDLAAAIVAETIPRWGQEFSNAEKWAFVTNILYAPEEGDEDDIETPSPSVLLNSVDFASAYAE